MFDRSHEVSASSTPSKLPANCTPIDLQEALEASRYADRALVELIKTASLSRFDPGEGAFGTVAHQISQDLQFGLSKLMDLCIDSHVGIIDSFVAQYKDSDDYILDKVEDTLEQVKKGWYVGDQIKLELAKAGALAKVVVLRGGRLASYAKELEERINDLLREKAPVIKGGKKQPAPLADQRGEEVAQ